MESDAIWQFMEQVSAGSNIEVLYLDHNARYILMNNLHK